MISKFSYKYYNKYDSNDSRNNHDNTAHFLNKNIVTFWDFL